MRQATGRSGADTITLLFGPNGPREHWRHNRHRERLIRRLFEGHPSYAPVIYMSRAEMERMHQPSKRWGRSFFDEMLNAALDMGTLAATPILKFKDCKPSKPWYRHKERW